MIAVQTRYVRRRVKSIAFHVSARGMSIIHTALSGAACLLFFGGMSCLMGLFQ